MSRGQMDLQVLYTDRHKVKDRGAKWDAGKRVWYVPHGADLNAFREWWPPRLERQITKEHEKILRQAIGNRADSLRGKRGQP